MPFEKTGVVLQISNRTDQATPGIEMHYLNLDSGETMDDAVGLICADGTVEVSVMVNEWHIKPNEIMTVCANGYDAQELYFTRDAKGQMIMTHGYAEKKVRGLFLAKRWAKGFLTRGFDELFF